MTSDAGEVSVTETAPSPVLTGFTIPWEGRAVPRQW